MEKCPNTPEMSAQDVEAMANAMLLDSSLPNSERGNEKVPEDNESDKLPEEGEGDKFSRGGSEKQPEETPAGKLVATYRKNILFPALNFMKQHILPLDSQNTENTI